MFRKVYLEKCVICQIVRRQYATASEVPNVKPFSEIPKIPTVPILRAGWSYLPVIGKYKLTAMHHAGESKYKEYGPLIREEINRDFSVLHVFDPDDIRKVFRNEGRMPDRRPLLSMKSYREKRKHIYKNTGVFFSNGQEWYDIRSQVQPHMMKPKSVHGYLNAMDEVAKEIVDKTAVLRKTNGGEVKDYLSELYKWALESVGIVALDARLGCLEFEPNQEAVRMISLVNDIFMQALKLEFSPLPLWKYFETPKYKMLCKNFDEFSGIAQKYLFKAKDKLENLPEGSEPTLLQLMISTANEPMHVTTMITDMFFAGIDTTSTTVGLTLYQLARNPEAQEKAHKEAKTVLQQKGMSFEALNDIRYIKACIKESMRLLPVVIGNGRTLSEDIVLSGYNVPAGTHLFMQGMIAGRSEKNFADPLKFKPERFLREEMAHDPFAFLPFGFGPRSCVGRRIAEQEIWTLMIRMLDRFRIEYRHGEIDLVTRLLSTPDRPLDFNFYDR